MITSNAAAIRRDRDLPSRVGYDAVLLVATLALCTAGGIFVLTSSAAHSWAIHHGDEYAIFWNHMGRMAWGLLCMTILAFVDYHFFERIARWVWVAALVALIIVLILPQPRGATAHRWIYVSGFSFQPAEFAKFALINYMAMRFGRFRTDPFECDQSKVYVGCLAIASVTLALIIAEPNLSTALMVLAVLSLMFFIFEVPLRPLLLLGGVFAVPLGLVAWFTPYMHSRLASYMDSIFHPLRSGYHVKQSLIGIGQGGMTGLGLGGSTQKNFFLPEPYKDFIFSIVGEEVGIIGSGLLLLGFGIVIARAWRTARLAPDSYGYYLAAGITFSIAASFIVNVGVTLGLLPATGQPLPFISYGGSSLMMNLAAIGVLLNISRQIHLRRSTMSLSPITDEF